MCGQVADVSARARMCSEPPPNVWLILHPRISCRGLEALHSFDSSQ